MKQRAAWSEYVGKLARSGSTGVLQLRREPPRATKYGNRPAFVDGIRFGSKLEADRFRELLLLQRAGHVLWFIRQVPFDVAPGVVYRTDFLVVWNRAGSAGDNVTVEDTKGVLTAVSRVKIAAVEHRYGFKVQLLRRADVSRG